MVAFANSRHGGAILIGVDEMKIADGRQRGKIVGCPVGDKEKLSIISRAESCIPPVEVQIIVENAGVLPFYRVEIPGGSEKPYCTSKGTYKIRGDGINQPLTPQRLLTLFVESESHEFIDRFQAATRELEQKMAQLYEGSATLEAILSRLFAAIQVLESAGEGSHGSSEALSAALERLEERIARIEAATVEPPARSGDAR